MFFLCWGRPGIEHFDCTLVFCGPLGIFSSGLEEQKVLFLSPPLLGGAPAGLFRALHPFLRKSEDLGLRFRAQGKSRVYAGMFPLR